jgi:hypothetical protein
MLHVAPSHTQVSPPRREFIRDALRYSVLVGLGAIVASAVARRAPLGGAACPGSGECSGCSLAAGCTLAQKNGATPQPFPTKGKP